jgi:hypothetical protein
MAPQRSPTPPVILKADVIPEASSSSMPPNTESCLLTHPEKRSDARILSDEFHEF